MRVTDGTTAAAVINNLQVGRSRLETLQQQVSTGFKVSAPSDDPVAAQQLLQLNGLIQDNEQYARNITTGGAWLNQMDGTLSEMGNVVLRAREIALAMSNDTNNATSRASEVSELKQLKGMLVQLGNSQLAGKYIFGGFVSDRPPFDVTAISNPPLPGPPPVADPLNGTPTGKYLGSDDAIQMEVGKGEYVSINYSGGKLLRGGTPPGSEGVDMIGEMDKLINALASNDVSGIRNSLPALENAQNQIIAARGDVGSRMSRLESISSGLESAKLGLQKLKSDRQDIDIVQVVSDLTRQQSAFEAALSAAGRISKLSLLDYLR